MDIVKKQRGRPRATGEPKAKAEGETVSKQILGPMKTMTQPVTPLFDQVTYAFSVEYINSGNCSGLYRITVLVLKNNKIIQRLRGVEDSLGFVLGKLNVLLSRYSIEYIKDKRPIDFSAYGIKSC